MPELFAYTDGACSGNPGPGGWGALMIAREGSDVVRERELNGGAAETTNNRMELMAAITAIEPDAQAASCRAVGIPSSSGNVWPKTPPIRPWPANRSPTK